MYARRPVRGDNAVSNVPFAGRASTTSRPDTFTVNLVCTSSISAFPAVGPTMQTAQLTALFVPN